LYSEDSWRKKHIKPFYAKQMLAEFLQNRPPKELFHDVKIFKRAIRLVLQFQKSQLTAASAWVHRDRPARAVEIVMPSRAERHLELLKLSRPLHRYARTLQPDTNASFLLVHKALAKAFAEGGGDLRPSAGLESSLRADMADAFLTANAHA